MQLSKHMAAVIQNAQRVCDEFAEGLKLARQGEIEIVEAEIAACLLEGVSLPDDHSQTLADLKAGRISCCRAIWLLIDEDQRPDWEKWRRSYMRDVFVNAGANAEDLAIFDGPPLN